MLFHWEGELICLKLSEFVYDFFFPLYLVLRERTRYRDREGAGLWWSPVHPVSGTTVTGPAVSESLVWQPHFCTLSHTQTHTLLYFTLVGAVCYPSGSVPSACLPAHHINPIMLHCSGCSGAGRQPNGKKRRRTWWGGRGNEKWGKAKAARGRRVCHAGITVFVLRFWVAGKESSSGTRNTAVPTKPRLTLVCVHNNLKTPNSPQIPQIQ